MLLLLSVVGDDNGSGDAPATDSREGVRCCCTSFLARTTFLEEDCRGSFLEVVRLVAAAAVLILLRGVPKLRCIGCCTEADALL